MNKIVHLHLKKFIAFTDLSIDFSPGINIIIGENGTGKTQLLKAILALREFTPRDWQRTFCVVFKNDTRPSLFDSRQFEKSRVRFNLDDLNTELGNFYEKILTEDINFYSGQLRQLEF